MLTTGKESVLAVLAMLAHQEGLRADPVPALQAAPPLPSAPRPGSPVGVWTKGVPSRQIDA